VYHLAPVSPICHYEGPKESGGTETECNTSVTGLCQ